MLDPFLAFAVAMTLSLEVFLMVMVTVLDLTDSIVEWQYDRRATSQAEPRRATAPSGAPVFLGG